MINFAISIIAGIMLADFLSGVIHWIQDRYAKASWPVVGGAVAKAQEHHKNVHKMLEASFMDRNGATFILVGLIALIVAAFGGLNLTTLTAIFVGAFSNEIHAMTHRRDAPWWVAIPRFVGLIQYPKHHAKHHRPPSRQAYCVITSWLNPALDHISFWTGLEGVLFVFGIWPNERKATK